VETLGHYHILNLWKYVPNPENRRNVLETCDFDVIIINFFEAKDLISKKGMLSVLLYFSLDGFFCKSLLYIFF
jgi:hypothetical protein